LHQTSTFKKGCTKHIKNKKNNKGESSFFYLTLWGGACRAGGGLQSWRGLAELAGGNSPKN